MMRGVYRARSGRLLSSVAAVLVLAVGSAACSADPETRKQKSLERGNDYVTQGKLQEAAIEFRNAVQADPKDAVPRVKLAETYLRLQDGAKALQEYVRAADLAPEDNELQLTTGTLLLAAGQLEAAQARADAILKRDANNAPAHVLRGKALGGLNDLPQALTEMEEAIRLDPERGASYTQLGLVQLARGEAGKAEEAFRKAIQVAPDWLDGRLALAQFLWAQNRHAEAETTFKAALATEPDNQAANRAFAVFLLSTGRREQAEAYLKRVADTSKSPSATMALADYYIEMKRPADAIAVLEPLAKASAGGAREKMARALALANRRPEAYALLADIVATDKTNSQALTLQAQLLHQDRKVDEALAAARTAVELTPANAETQFVLGRIYATRGDTAAAERAYREVLRLNPRAVTAQVELAALKLATSPADSLALSEAAAKIQPESVEVRLSLVRSLLSSKEFARAERELAALLREQPANSVVHTQAGLLAALRGQLPQARAAFEHALSLQPGSIDALSGLIALDLKAGDKAAVRNRLASRVSTSTEPDFLLLAARSYMAINESEEAERILRRAIDVAPSVLPAYSMLGQVYLRRGELDRAWQEFDGLAQRQATPVGALTMSGVILQSQGKVAEARQRYERAIAADPRAPVAANNLAWIYAEAGENLSQAVRLAEAAAEALPDAPEVLDTLGWAYYRSRLFTSAVPAFTRAVAKDPRNPVYHYHLGLAQEEAGDSAAARRSLGRALELDPQFDGAADARQRLARLADEPQMRSSRDQR